MLAFLAFLFLTSETFGQERLEKGNYFIGGGVSYLSSSENSNDDPNISVDASSRRRIAFSPYVGRLISNNLAIGLGVDISSLRTENIVEIDNYQSSNEFNEKSYSANVFLKKFWPISSKFGAYLSPSIFYSTSNGETFTIAGTDEGYVSRDIESKSAGLSTTLDIYYFISPKFSLETSLANVVVNKRNSENIRYDKIGDITTTEKAKTSYVSFDLANRLSFDKILVLNYFF